MKTLENNRSIQQTFNMSPRSRKLHIKIELKLVPENNICDNQGMLTQISTNKRGSIYIKMHLICQPCSQKFNTIFLNVTI